MEGDDWDARTDQTEEPFNGMDFSVRGERGLGEEDSGTLVTGVEVGEFDGGSHVRGTTYNCAHSHT